MFIAIGTMILGVVIGYLMRRIPHLSFIKSIPTLFIFLLLFSLGITVGSNKLIIENLYTMGWQALVVTIGAMLGSLVLSAILYHRYFKGKENEK